MILVTAANFKRFLCTSLKYYHYKAVVLRLLDVAEKLLANDLVNNKVPVNPRCRRKQLQDVFTIPLSVINPVIFKNFFDGILLPWLRVCFGLHTGSKQQDKQSKRKSHSKYLLKQSNVMCTFNQSGGPFAILGGAHG
ncbi:hypothetical protein PsAD14_02570 [Pseudovibrio sp. Ad14]|nr:hypothetical protein PsW74_03745 [Pseudovibrio sp. W74]KZL08991.1 hypothetical protein PsAD14_02570 [Pseudovibrio sp. Ad14]